MKKGKEINHLGYAQSYKVYNEAWNKNITFSLNFKTSQSTCETLDKLLLNIFCNAGCCTWSCCGAGTSFNRVVVAPSRAASNTCSSNFLSSVLSAANRVRKKNSNISIDKTKSGCKVMLLSAENCKHTFLVMHQMHVRYHCFVTCNTTVLSNFRYTVCTYTFFTIAFVCENWIDLIPIICFKKDQPQTNFFRSIFFLPTAKAKG